MAKKVNATEVTVKVYNFKENKPKAGDVCAFYMKGDYYLTGFRDTSGAYMQFENGNYCGWLDSADIVKWFELPWFNEKGEVIV